MHSLHMPADMELPDEVFGFGSWLLWLVATRATALVDRTYEAGPARPSQKYGMADGHHLPTPSLVAWLLTAAELRVLPEELAHRDRRADERQKVLRTSVSRALAGESPGQQPDGQWQVPAQPDNPGGGLQTRAVREANQKLGGLVRRQSIQADHARVLKRGAT